MASPIDPSLPPSAHLVEVVDQTSSQSFNVRGSLPRAVSGRWLGVGDGVVHSVHLRGGRVLSYRSRSVGSEDGTGDTTSHIVVFGGSILAFGAGTLAQELTPDLVAAHPVDLAGRGQALSACPRHDPVTGDLHLLAVAPDGAQAHVEVSSGALTRHSRTILDAPNEVRDLAITRDHVLFMCDGFVGVTTREPGARAYWIATGVDAPVPVHAHDIADGIVVHALTPALERWTLNVEAATVDCDVLDPSPRRFAGTSGLQRGGAPRLLWTVGERTADLHDLVSGRHVRHSFGLSRPGDLVYVADPSRPRGADGGWLVGFVHHVSLDETDLVVLDAADNSRPAVAAVRLPRRIPPGLHTTWIPEPNP